MKTISATIITYMRPGIEEKLDLSKHVKFISAKIDDAPFIEWNNPKHHLKMKVDSNSVGYDSELYGEVRHCSIGTGNAGKSNKNHFIQSGVPYKLSEIEMNYFESIADQIIIPNKFRGKITKLGQTPDWDLDAKALSKLTREFLNMKKRPSSKKEKI